MNPVRPTIAVFLFVGAVMPAVCLSQDVYLKEMPEGGDIPFGKVVYVDDGQCPKGEVKEVRGGSRVKGIARQVRCVKSAFASSEFDGRYSGRITCDVIPGQTNEQLNTALSITIVNAKAEYQREVLQPDSRYPLGVTERGSSPVSSSGELSLTGAAAGPTWRYEATYTGRLEGKTAQLTGQQVWHFQGKPIHTRPCSIAVRIAE